MAETYKKWAEKRLKEQPTFKTFSEALQEARKRAAKSEDCSIYKVPKDRGGYAVINWNAYEVAYREGYEKIVDYLKIDDVEEIEEA